MLEILKIELLSEILELECLLFFFFLDFFFLFFSFFLFFLDFDFFLDLEESSSLSDEELYSIKFFRIL